MPRKPPKFKPAGQRTRQEQRRVYDRKRGQQEWRHWYKTGRWQRKRQRQLWDEPLGGLIFNGARKNVTPWIRAVSAAAGFLLFIAISVGYAASGVISTWLAVYPVFALVELVNIYRAVHDAGEGYAST